MKTKVLIIIALCASIPAIACAGKKDKKQKGAETAVVEEQKAVEETPVITEDCIINVSLFHESCKNKQYADAIEPWRAVLNECPSASPNVYADGVKIAKWKLANTEVGSAEYNEWREMLMSLYDKRCKYFGDHKSYPTPYILGEKALDYQTYFPEDSISAASYPWLKASVEGMGAQSKITVVDRFFEVSFGMYRANNDLGEQFIADYQLAGDILTQISLDDSNKNAGAAPSHKDRIDQMFAVSGAANCDKLDELYRAEVTKVSGDAEALAKIVFLYERMGCLESDVYFAASKAAHELNPTAKTAAGCAAMCKKEKNWNGALSYYDQAAELAENKIDRAEYLYRAAHVCATNLNSSSKAIDYCNKSLQHNPNQGRCYILKASLIAKMRPYGDPILNRSVYWVAYDLCSKAIEVDPLCEKDARKLMSSYRSAWPTTEEIFFHKDLNKGASFSVSGCGSTTVRSRD